MNLADIGLVQFLSSYRLRFGTEEQLHEDVATALSREGFEFVREYILSPADRIDFYLPKWRIGIECKIEGGPTAVAAQLLRYAGSPEIAELLLITNRRSQLLQEDMLGKPCRSLWIGGASL